MAKLAHVLTSVLLAMALFAGACSREESEVSLAWLVEQQQTFDGKQLATRGVVRGFDDPEHYWIEDEAGHRVALEPQAQVRGLVGEKVRVSGRFSYRPDAGRRIVLDELQRIDD